MPKQLALLTILSLSAAIAAGCGGDSRRAESETAATSPTSSLPTSEPSGNGAVQVDNVTDPARRAYVTSVDAVCGRLDSERGTEQERVATATVPEEAAKTYEDSIALGWRELRQIERIAEPPGDAAVLRANVFAPIRHQLALRAQMRDALAVADVPRLEQLRTELDNSTRTLTGFARGYGFRVCGED